MGGIISCSSIMKRKTFLAFIDSWQGNVAESTKQKRMTRERGTNHIRCARHGVIIVGILRFYPIIPKISPSARFFSTFAN